MLFSGKRLLDGLRQHIAAVHDLAEMRLRAMDEGEVEISVLSATSPSIQGIKNHEAEAETARAWNDYVAEVSYDYRCLR